MVSGATPRSGDPEVWPLIVVGAGAAGLTAAIFASRAGVRTLLLETRRRPGAKIRVSGGGRCNVLPSRVTLDDYQTSGSQKTLRNILFSWPLEEVRRFFEDDLGVALVVEEDTGKVFPRSNDAREIVSALLGASEEAGVLLRGECRISAVTVAEGGGGFELESEAGERLHCRRLVLATGGLSLPKSGSDGHGLRLAQVLGHGLTPTFPALVPLLTPDAGWQSLTGLSLPVTLSALQGEKLLERRRGDFLFTHRGFSGPVALDISHRFSGPGGEALTLQVQWGPVIDWDARLREGGRRAVGALLREHLPRRLAVLLQERAGLSPDAQTSGLTRAERRALVAQLERCPLAVQGSEGYRTAEVTAGGVPLAEVVTRTLESRKTPGLHLCGEILDAIGRIGGYNFLWAWVTGRKVGLAVAREAPADA